jgi:hypothetical protein
LAYQPPASSTFLSEQTATSNQPAVLFSQKKSTPAISHQPTEQAVGHETPVSCPMKIILKKVVLIKINLTIPALLQLGHGKFDRQHINVLVSKSSPTLLPLTFHLYDWNTQH